VVGKANRQTKPTSSHSKKAAKTDKAVVGMNRDLLRAEALILEERVKSFGKSCGVAKGKLAKVQQALSKDAVRYQTGPPPALMIVQSKPSKKRKATEAKRRSAKKAKCAAPASESDEDSPQESSSDSD
jgi:hypothetical protein